ncbi:hypothetical protein LE190_03670 [Massilia oculi]|uniref:Uncharacterized protein n=1 Tax=Massilia hydrophila TaxID=3044279 RepID=A0ABS7Y5U4_9BURK|nr:hypothetical protein [Massilia oculi]MCA1855029.1 hypothetical protein [Massilia oculi]
MLSRYKLNHMAAGLLDKFIGRNNGYECHWALGVLYCEARQAGNRVELDLLAGSAFPALPASTSMAHTWQRYLQLALGRHGETVGGLTEASIAVAFGLPPVPKRPGYIEYGDPFQCTLRLVAANGRCAERRRMQHCHPADEFWNPFYGPYVP